MPRLSGHACVPGSQLEAPRGWWVLRPGPWPRRETKPAVGLVSLLCPRQPRAEPQRPACQGAPGPFRGAGVCSGPPLLWQHGRQAPSSLAASFYGVPGEQRLRLCGFVPLRTRLTYFDTRGLASIIYRDTGEAPIKAPKRVEPQPRRGGRVGQARGGERAGPGRVVRLPPQAVTEVPRLATLGDDVLFPRRPRSPREPGAGDGILRRGGFLPFGSCSF